MSITKSHSRLKGFARKAGAAVGAAAVLVLHRAPVGERLTNRRAVGRTAVTGETAILLSQAFGTSAEFWMRLQADYELALAREANNSVSGITPPEPT